MFCLVIARAMGYFHREDFMRLIRICFVVLTIMLTQGQSPFLSQSAEFIWGDHAGGKNVDYGYGVAVNDEGDVFVNGHFQETA